jgi:SAM-dependent methyltransferase
MNEGMEREILETIRHGGAFEELRRRFVGLIETHRVPHAENITARSDWLFYVYFCRWVTTFLPDRQARIIDWGGLYGQVTRILHCLGYSGTSNYLLHENPHYPIFQQTLDIPTLWGRHPNQLELEDRSVDAFISSGVLEHVREDGVGDETVILKEVHRVLKEDGRLFIWNLPARWGSSELLAILAGKWHHAYRYRRKDVLQLFPTTDWEMVTLDKHKFLPGTAREWLGRWIDPVRLLQGDDRLSRWWPFSVFARDYVIVAKKIEPLWVP